MKKQRQTLLAVVLILSAPEEEEEEEGGVRLAALPQIQHNPPLTVTGVDPASPPTPLQFPHSLTLLGGTAADSFSGKSKLLSGRP